MDSEKNGRSNEDRISTLPNELLHEILAPLGAKICAQTSAFSTRWRDVWTSLPHLDFDSRQHPTKTRFSRFVQGFISNRCPQSTVSYVRFQFGEFDKNIIKQTLCHVDSNNPSSLKHLTLITDHPILDLRISPTSGLQCLTTLHLEQTQVECTCRSNPRVESFDLFERFVNLKSLTLINCCLKETSAFHITASRLETLSISYNLPWFNEPRICKFVVSAPNLKFFQYEGFLPLYLSMSYSCRPERVNILLSWKESAREFASTNCLGLVNMFHQLRDAASLNLSSGVVEGLSLLPRHVLPPSPFCNLRHLIISCSHHPLVPYDNVIAYFTKSSPNAAAVYDL